MNSEFLVILSVLLSSPFAAFAQSRDQKPDAPVEKWAGKTIMLIGAHADDDALSHGTLAMLQAHGNHVYVVTLTTGNVGTQDPKLSRTQLAQIRRQEELAALAELGIPGEHYINLGYDDGLLEFEDRKAVVENLVRWIRKLRPDVLMAWDPGRNYQRWHKSDHRAAAYLAADAARAAMWRLLFEGQITQEGLKEYMVPEGVEELQTGDFRIRIERNERQRSQSPAEEGWKARRRVPLLSRPPRRYRQIIFTAAASLRYFRFISFSIVIEPSART